MNEKITLPSLVQQLALKTGDTRKQSEDFIKEFFNLVSASLQEGEQVKVKSLGVFKTVTVGARKSVNVSTGEETLIPIHRKVVFVPSKDIAERVNDPFEMFDTVEVNDDVFDENHKDEGEQVVEEEKNDNNATSPQINISNQTLPADQIELKFEKESSNHDKNDNVSVVKDNDVSTKEYASDSREDESTEFPIQKSGREEINDSRDENQILNTHLSHYEEYKDEQNHYSSESRSRFGIGYLSGFISAIVICGLVFSGWYFIDWNSFKFKNDIESKQNSQTPVFDDPLIITEPDSKQIANNDANKTVDNSVVNEETNPDDKDVPTSPSDRKVYDTISETRYLSTMAKDHYGNFNLWPYIYMENQAFLGHPDRIKPGTKVVIPPLSKYNVKADSPEDVAKAKKLGVQIYSKFK